MNPRLTPWATIYRASRRSTQGERAAEFEKRKLCATPLLPLRHAKWFRDGRKAKPAMRSKSRRPQKRRSALPSFRPLGTKEVSLCDVLDCKDCGIKHQRVGCGMEEKGKSDLAGRLYYEGRQQSPSDHRYLIGAHMHHDGWLVDCSVRRYFRHNYKRILHKNEIVYFSEQVFDLPKKIVWRQTSDRIRAAIIGKHWFANTLQAGILRDERYDYRYVLGLLNSRFLNFIYMETVKEGGRVFPQVKLAKVRDLPFRTIDFSDAPDKARHDEMVAKVDAMLEAKKQLGKAKTDKDKTYYENKCAALDRQIDRLVYELYGLTEEEVQIIDI